MPFSINRLQELANTDFNNYWLVPDNENKFVKIIPKNNRPQRAIHFDSSEMSKKLKRSVKIIQKAIKENPNWVSNSENLEAFFTLEKKLLSVCEKMETAVAYSIQNTLESTLNEAIAEVVQSDSDQRIEERLQKLDNIKENLKSSDAKNAMQVFSQIIQLGLSIHIKVREKHSSSPSFSENDLKIAQVLSKGPPAVIIGSENYGVLVESASYKEFTKLEKKLLLQVNEGNAVQIIMFIIKNNPSKLFDIKFKMSLFDKLNFKNGKQIILTLLEDPSTEKIAIKMVADFNRFANISTDRLAKLTLKYFDNTSIESLLLSFNLLGSFLKRIEEKDRLLLIHLFKNGLNKDLFFKGLLQNPIASSLKIFQDLSNKHLLLDFASYTKKTFGRGPADELFFSVLDSKAYDLLASMISLGLPVDVSTLTNAFHSQNYQALNLLLTPSSLELITNNADHYLTLLMRIEDPRLAKYLLDCIPTLTSLCSASLLEKAVLEGSGWFVDWVIKDMKISSSEISELIPKALESYHLKIIKALCEKGGVSYPQILNIEKIKEEDLLDHITKYAIMSPLPDLYELAKSHPSILLVLPEALKKASLVVRFPNLIYPSDINNKQISANNYLAGTLDYAEENILFVRKLLSDLLKLSRNTLLDTIIQNHYDRFKDPKPFHQMYLKKQILAPSNAVTPLKTISVDTEARCIVKTVELTCYGASWKHLADFCFNWNEMKWKVPLMYPSMSRGGANQLLYRYYINNPDDKSNCFFTTRLSMDGNYEWTHTGASTIKDLQDHLESLHKEILNFPLDYADETSRKPFFEKIARGYWLIATLCETRQGTPHNSMIWLNLIYEHHGLPPPIPLQEYFFLNNTMLMIPFERAIEMWESFFELPFDQSFSVKSPEEKFNFIKSFLTINGTMLRLCSPEIRDNEELARLAIKQNPGAKIYASKRVQKLIEVNNS